MNRETRKANLRKLQLPGTSSGTTTRKKSLKSPSTSTTAISNYFSIPSKSDHQTHLIPNKQNDVFSEIVDNSNHGFGMDTDAKESSLEPNISEASPNISSTVDTKLKLGKRTKLASFLYKEKSNIPTTIQPNADDFEEPLKKVKKAPKSKALTKSKSKTTRLKGQPNIKSAFLRNEQLFSEITAQHCLADHFSPDDMQIALALSKSEAEISGILCIADEEETVVDVDKCGENVQESIRSKLQKYGFRTAPKEEYSSIAATFRMGDRRNKSKWANKFTALTCRDPAFQIKKVNEKIDAFIRKQVTSKDLSITEQYIEPYHINSSALKRIRPVQSAEVIRDAEYLNTDMLSKFYVETLFNISSVKVGHLLKDWARIQGRDVSPDKKSYRKRELEKKLSLAYKDLEEFFSKEGEIETSLMGENIQHQNKTDVDKESASTECKTVDAYSNSAIEGVSMSPNSVLQSELQECPIKPKCLLSKCSENYSLLNKIPTSVDITDKDKTAGNTSLNQVTNDTPCISPASYSEKEQSKYCNKPGQMATIATNTGQCVRAISPDIFADSDSDVEEIKNKSITEKNNMITEIEILSSDEEKSAFLENNHDDIMKVVDLTQEDEVLNPLEASSISSKVSPECVDVFVTSPSETPTRLETTNITTKRRISTSYVLSSDEEVLLDIQANEEGSSFLNFEGDKQLSTSFHLETAPPKPIDYNINAANNTIFEALKRKYLRNDVNSPSIRKSISMTQIHESTSNRSCRKDLSFTQMDRKVKDPEEKINNNFQSPNAASNYSLERCTKSSSFNWGVSNLSLTQIPASNEDIVIGTQNFDNDESDDDCIVLSDDEINYSICMANKTRNLRAEDENSLFSEDLSITSTSVSENEEETSSQQLKSYNSDRDLDSHQNKESQVDSATLEKHDLSFLDLIASEKSIKSIESFRRISTIEKEPTLSGQFRMDLSITSTSVSENEGETSSQQLKSYNSNRYLDSHQNKESQVDSAKLEKHDLSFLDLIASEKSIKSIESFRRISTIEKEPTLSGPFRMDLCSAKSKHSDLTRERAQFGILDSFSEPFTQSPYTTPPHNSTGKLLTETSFLNSPSETAAPMKRYSCSKSSQKFNDLVKTVEKYEASDSDSFDEFDELVFGKRKSDELPKPTGFELLLTGEISFHDDDRTSKKDSPRTKTPSPLSKAISSEEAPQDIEIDGKMYTVRVTTSPKPDFVSFSDIELHNRLYEFGIKPLKREEALAFLDYIYNQTHPILVRYEQETEQKSQQQSSIITPEPSPRKPSQTKTAKLNLFGNMESPVPNLPSSSPNKLNLKDCSGELLLRHRHYLVAELENEEYIFQTNVSKRISQALLPLHIAWFNLVCSSSALHEAILMFEPIDLQEIYLFLKSLGYRYFPNDLKNFFDRRCIIFRYNLTNPNTEKENNRHVRKKKSKPILKN